MESGLAMLAFVRTVQCNGFTRAAHDLGVTPSAVSKLVTRLERRLGVRLLQRSTRRMALTAEGTLYFERVQRIVAEIEDAESDVMRFSTTPRGRVRIAMGNAFANFALVPALPEFMARFPEISLDLVVTEYKLDLVEAGLDLAIRFGPLGELNLAARRIGEFERVVAAAPAYLERHGTPRTPEELAQHNCLTLAGVPGQTEWPFRSPRGTRSIAVRGNLNIDNAETLYEAALAGLGIIRLADIVVGPAIQTGHLVPILLDVHQPEPLPVHAVYAPERRRPPRIEAVLQFLVEKFGSAPWRLPRPIGRHAARAKGSALAAAPQTLPRARPLTGNPGCDLDRLKLAEPGNSRDP
jgi:DNA-binding transcriptional LysR family regulator